MCIIWSNLCCLFTVSRLTQAILYLGGSAWGGDDQQWQRGTGKKWQTFFTPLLSPSCFSHLEPLFPFLMVFPVPVLHYSYSGTRSGIECHAKIYDRSRNQMHNTQHQGTSRVSGKLPVHDTPGIHIVYIHSSPVPVQVNRVWYSKNYSCLLLKMAADSIN